MLLKKLGPCLLLLDSLECDRDPDILEFLDEFHSCVAFIDNHSLATGGAVLTDAEKIKNMRRALGEKINPRHYWHDSSNDTFKDFGKILRYLTERYTEAGDRSESLYGAPGIGDPDTPSKYPKPPLG